MAKVIEQDEANSVLFNALMESCKEIITIKDTSLRYIACNNAFLKHFELDSVDKIVGKTIYEFLPKENYDIIENNIKKIKLTSKSLTYTMKVNYKNSVKVVQQALNPVFENGKIKYFLTISRDITSDENLKEQLIEKNTQLNTLLEYSPVLTYMKNKKKEYILGSKYAKDFVFEGIDRHVDNLQLDMNSVFDKTEDEDNRVINNQELIIKEKSILDFNQNIHWYNTVKAPVVRADGTIDGLITITRNIDKQKNLENQKDLFIATLVHDLKNPLLAQISSLDLIVKGYFGKIDETQLEILTTTLESANYMKEMLYTLINTYKYDSGSVVLEKSKVDIEKLIKTCIREHSSLALERKVEVILKSDLVENEKNLMIDSRQIRRVIANLLNNGINYADKNSIFTIEVKNKDEFVEILFTNQGILIDESTQEHLFEKYITEANKYQKIGFGLGMYLSKKILQAHNGDISYIPTQPNLNTFCARLPRNNGKRERVVW